VLPHPAVAAGATLAIDQESVVAEILSVSGSVTLELVLPPSVSKSLVPFLSRPSDVVSMKVSGED
jgi:hypothetical protein